ncbi:SDR family NAD(P)-dependent oxidoreductase [Piscibacillus salipiscarius]|uniref:SDR family NAD(P)-dependent oxidoreductase n=1 Tax=Piscibacillus salipiscarius TaxID=299480 RepID=A0ABW5QBN8_9BACI|nr:glucose 1-dehydrogenase [Piscibacillus salipiscarius]
MRLINKVAIITGGGGGIGRATAIRFAQEGAKVLVADVNEEEVKETARLVIEYGGESVFSKCDMSNSSDVERMVDDCLKAYGKIDILFNNAGVGSQEMKLPDVSIDDWQRVFNININGVFYGMKYVIPHMSEGASIVNTASIAGIKGQKLVSAYSASKGSVITLTKTAATEFGRKNIRINAVAPGVIDTQMVENWKETDKWPVLSTANALRRVGKAEEIANAVLFLASDEASFITGETLVVDGGTLNM